MQRVQGEHFSDFSVLEDPSVFLSSFARVASSTGCVLEDGLKKAGAIATYFASLVPLSSGGERREGLLEASFSKAFEQGCWQILVGSWPMRLLTTRVAAAIVMLVAR